MLRCDRAALDTDQGILFCGDGGPCGKRLHCGDCPLMSQTGEKEFEIGQRVRIVGPTADERATYWFPASSLELVGPEPDRLEAIDRRLDSIEKRLQALEGKANNEVATDISDELPELHVGNYVEVVGRPFGILGLPVGTIDRVSYQAPFGWFTLEGSEAWYPLRSLRKLSDEEIIAKIGRERKA